MPGIELPAVAELEAAVDPAPAEQPARASAAATAVVERTRNFLFIMVFQVLQDIKGGRVNAPGKGVPEPDGASMGQVIPSG